MSATILPVPDYWVAPGGIPLPESVPAACDFCDAKLFHGDDLDPVKPVCCLPCSALAPAFYQFRMVPGVLQVFAFRADGRIHGHERLGVIRVVEQGGVRFALIRNLQMALGDPAEFDSDCIVVGGWEAAPGVASEGRTCCRCSRPVVVAANTWPAEARVICPACGEVDL